MNRRKTHPHLIQKRKQKRNAANSQARDETSEHGGAKRAQPKQRHAQQRMRRLRRMQPISRQQPNRQHEQPQHRTKAQRMLAENFKHVRKQRDTGSKKNQAAEIEPGDVLCAVVGQMPVNEIKASQPNRNVYKENKTPVQVPDD